MEGKKRREIKRSKMIVSYFNFTVNFAVIKSKQVTRHQKNSILCAIEIFYPNLFSLKEAKISFFL